MPMPAPIANAIRANLIWKYLRRAILFAFLALPLIQGCIRPFSPKVFDDSRNSFYTRDYDLDDPRIPLIEPFELVKTPIGGWSINIDAIESDDIVPGETYSPVDLVYCSNEMIYCHVLENAPGHCPQLPQLSFPERWFTINMADTTITNYKGGQVFRAGIGDSIYLLLKTPDTLYAHFCDDIWALPWIPDTVITAGIRTSLRHEKLQNPKLFKSLYNFLKNRENHSFTPTTNPNKKK